MIDEEIILKNLFRRLWDIYVGRVSYAHDYQKLVLGKSGHVHNDHIAFRTIKTRMSNGYPTGILGISRVLLAFEYEAKGQYEFVDKHLHAVHYEHPCKDLPLIFVSELLVDELPDDIQHIINATVNTDIKDEINPWLLNPKFEKLQNMDLIVDNLVDFFYTYSTPWGTPNETAIRIVNEASQYGAWTLLHGNSVNHYTACVNRQNVDEWPDIETTVQGLLDNGVPMKSEIEGKPGSKLRQTATKPVIEKIAVLDDEGNVKDIEWPYAYYEIAERGEVDGELFTGFLGAQATHLFEMTKKE